VKSLLRGAVLACVLCACSPYHDLKDGRSILGGGFKDQEVAPGLFGIMVKSNASLWTTHDAVHETWSKRAAELCAPDGYTELAAQDLENELPSTTGGALHDVVTTRIAFALCTRSALTAAQATEVISGLGFLPKSERARQPGSR
jgi:hypothetical protein